MRRYKCFTQDGYAKPLRFAVLLHGEVVTKCESLAARSLARHLRSVHGDTAVSVTYDDIEPLLGSWVDYFSA